MRRYKRFLADVVDARVAFTMHCPNPGAMSGCADPAAVVFGIEERESKYAYAGNRRNVTGNCRCESRPRQRNRGEALAAQRITA